MLSRYEKQIKHQNVKDLYKHYLNDNLKYESTKINSKSSIISKIK